MKQSLKARITEIRESKKIKTQKPSIREILESKRNKLKKSSRFNESLKARLASMKKNEAEEEVVEEEVVEEEVAEETAAETTPETEESQVDSEKTTTTETEEEATATEDAPAAGDEVEEMDSGDFIKALTDFATTNNLVIDNISEKEVSEKIIIIFSVSNETTTAIVSYDGNSLTITDLSNNSTLTDTVDSVEDFFDTLNSFLPAAAPVVEEKMKIEGTIPLKLKKTIGSIKECFDDLLLGNTGLNVTTSTNPDGSVCIEVLSPACCVTINVSASPESPVDILAVPEVGDVFKNTLPEPDAMNILDATIDALNFSERVHSSPRLFIKKSESMKKKPACSKYSSKCSKTESKSTNTELKSAFSQSENYQIKRFFECMGVHNRIINAFVNGDYATVIAALKETKSRL